MYMHMYTHTCMCMHADTFTPLALVLKAIVRAYNHCWSDHGIVEVVPAMVAKAPPSGC